MISEKWCINLFWSLEARLTAIPVRDVYVYLHVHGDVALD